MQPGYSQPNLSYYVQQPPAPWGSDFYHISLKIFTIGAKYRIYDAQGRIVAFCHRKPFRLRDEIYIYTDESMRYPLLHLKQQNILNAAAVFAVIDPTINQTIGFFGRKFWRSTFQDMWKIYDPWQREIGVVTEESGCAVLRRFLPIGFLIPKKYSVSLYGRTVAIFNQKLKIIGDEWDLDFRPDPYKTFDRRIGLSAALLMAIIERHLGG